MRTSWLTPDTSRARGRQRFPKANSVRPGPASARLAAVRGSAGAGRCVYPQGPPGNALCRQQAAPYPEDVPDRKAAIDAVTSNLSAFAQHPYRAVNRTAAIDDLCRSRGLERGEATELCREAVKMHLCGYVRHVEPAAGVRCGLPSRLWAKEEWWIRVAP
jgi:hypothetical protein